MSYYYLFLSFHLLCVLIWITSIFYMQRLVYLQVKHKEQTLIDEGLFVYKKIANPAFLGSIIFGIILISLNKSILESGLWIYIKFFMISLIIIIHHLSKIHLNEVREDILFLNKKSISYHSFSPFILASLIIFLTIIKPF